MNQSIIFVLAEVILLLRWMEAFPNPTKLIHRGNIKDPIIDDCPSDNCPSVEEATIGNFAQHKMKNLLDSLEVPMIQRKGAFRELARLMASVSNRPLHAEPSWSSDITDDGSPFEISLEFDGDAVGVRILAEAWDDDMAATQGWNPALALTEQLASEPGVDLERFWRIAEIYKPKPQIRVAFSLWHSAVVTPSGQVKYKVYLNPNVNGASAASEMVRETLRRLNMEHAWPRVQRLLTAGSGHNELLCVSLDLQSGDHSRLKIYVAHHNLHMSTLDEHLQSFPRYQAGTVPWLAQRLAQSEGPFKDRPVLTCLSFTNNDSEPQVTSHFPARCYVENDALLLQRLTAPLDERRQQKLQQAVKAYAGRALGDGRGLITYVSLRKSDTTLQDQRMVIYLSPEAYAVSPPQSPIEQRAAQSVSKTEGVAGILDIIATRQRALEDHPFITSLGKPKHYAKMLAEEVGFFILTFQDLTRLVMEHTKDPYFRSMAEQHHQEDLGHDKWFLHDVSLLGVDLNAEHLFSNRLAASRDVSYQLLSHAMTAYDDLSRMVLMLALESSGQVFFGRVLELLIKDGRADELKFFGQRHHDAEEAHSLYEDDEQSTLSTLKADRQSLQEAERIVHKVFDAMTEWSNDMAERWVGQLDG